MPSHPISKSDNLAVDFLLIGATKAGTESIYEFFRDIPDVLARDKQQHYFCQGIFGPGYDGLETELKSYEEYEKCKPLGGQGTIVGDFDCLTMHGPKAIQLIKQVNPSAKIMVILRNPVERAYSHYWMDVRECFESRPFLRAIREDYGKYTANSAEYCPLIRLGFYADQLAKFRETFGEENVRVWFYGDYQNKPEVILREMCDFIHVSVPPGVSMKPERLNETAMPRSAIIASLLRARRGRLRSLRRYYLKLPHKLRRFIKQKILTNAIAKPTMPSEARQFLTDIYKNDILKLEKITGRELTQWIRHPEAGIPLPADIQKAKQVRFFDDAVDEEFEINRPRGTGRLYEWSISQKFILALESLSFPVRGCSLLDVCCGSGMAAEFYAEAGAFTTGLDISERSVSRAEERARRHGFDAKFIAGDAENLPFPDQSFDVVSVHDGLHHLPDPLRAVQEMSRVARRAIIVIEPARSWLTKQAVLAGLALDYEEAGNLVYRFRRDEIFEIAKKAGFSRLSSRQYFLYYVHEPFGFAKYMENTPLFYSFPITFWALSAIAPKLGNKLCVVCERIHAK